MSAGFIYVLVNSSMPGIIKVGKTTRTPSERVEELSGVTGVPTPFIIAYEEHFSDCDAAEQFLHTKLTQLGVRVSDGREFFRAGVSDVIKIIASIPSSLTTFVNRDQNVYPASQETSPEPWKETLQSGDDFYFGSGNNLRNYERAYKFYQDAVRLGSLRAIERLGDMHWYGQAVREDRYKSIDLFMRSALAGNYFGYARLAIAYMFTREYDNLLKAASNFVAGGEADEWMTVPEYSQEHLMMMFQIIDICGILTEARPWQPQLVDIFHSYSDLVLALGNQALAREQQSGNVRAQTSIRSTIQVLRSYLNSHPAPVRVLRQMSPEERRPYLRRAIEVAEKALAKKKAAACCAETGTQTAD